MNKETPYPNIVELYVDFIEFYEKNQTNVISFGVTKLIDYNYTLNPKNP